MTLTAPASRCWPTESPCPTLVPPFLPLHGDGSHYVIHVGIGLERLAASEVTEALGATHVTVLQGRVAFRTDYTLADVRLLCSAESVSLLCWLSPMPSMPAGDEFVDAFRGLLARHVIPQAARLEKAWRTAVGSDIAEASSVPFRVTARRGGVNDGSCVSRQDLGRLLAEAWHDASTGGFCATARGYELDILLQWSSAQILIELPAHTESRRLTTGRLSARSYCPVPALHAPIGWALAALAELRQGCRVLDPMCGRAGILLEAARLQPRASAYVGCDKSSDQLQGAAANAHAAARQGMLPLLLLHANATQLPFHDGSVDVVLSDLPFGRKHGRKLGLYSAALREWRRVLRQGGCAVLLTTCKAELEEAVSADPAWVKVGRHHMLIGSLTACAHVLRRQ